MVSCSLRARVVSGSVLTPLLLISVYVAERKYRGREILHERRHSSPKKQVQVASRGICCLDSDASGCNASE